jgi:hypothetical protein
MSGSAFRLTSISVVRCLPLSAAHECTTAHAGRRWTTLNEPRPSSFVPLRAGTNQSTQSIESLSRCEERRQHEHSERNDKQKPSWSLKSAGYVSQRADKQRPSGGKQITDGHHECIPRVGFVRAMRVIERQGHPECEAAAQTKRCDGNPHVRHR